MTRQIRVVLADDQALIRAGFRVLIDSAADLEVVGEAADGREASRSPSARADVVLMDIRMPELDGIEATRLITADEDLAGVRVLILTTFEIDENVLRALRAGASGFLSKSVNRADLLDAIRVVAGGEALLSPKATHSLITRFLDSPEPLPRPHRPSSAPDRPGTGDPRPGRGRAVERRHRRTAVRVAADRQDPRQPGDDEAGRTRPGATRRHRVPERPGPARRPAAGTLRPRVGPTGCSLPAGLGQRITGPDAARSRAGDVGGEGHAGELADRVGQFRQPVGGAGLAGDGDDLAAEAGLVGRAEGVGAQHDHGYAPGGGIVVQGGDDVEAVEVGHEQVADDQVEGAGAGEPGGRRRRRRPPTTWMPSAFRVAVMSCAAVPGRRRWRARSSGWPMAGGMSPCRASQAQQRCRGRPV